MTKEQAKEFALTIVPSGAFSKKDAQKWCDFLNYILEHETFKPFPATSDWAKGMFYVGAS